MPLPNLPVYQQVYYEAIESRLGLWGQKEQRAVAIVSLKLSESVCVADPQAVNLWIEAVVDHQPHDMVCRRRAGR